MILLKKVKEFFECGVIYFQRDKRKNHSDCYRYEISDFQKIAGKVIPFFVTHKLQSKSKKNDFRLFYKIFKMVQKQKHFTKKGLAEIMKLKSQMHKNRARRMREIRSSGGNGN